MSDHDIDDFNNEIPAVMPILVPTTLEFSSNSGDGSTTTIKMVVVSEGPPHGVYLNMISDKFKNLVRSLYETNNET